MIATEYLGYVQGDLSKWQITYNIEGKQGSFVVEISNILLLHKRRFDNLIQRYVEMELKNEQSYSNSAMDVSREEVGASRRQTNQDNAAVRLG